MRNISRRPAVVVLLALVVSLVGVVIPMTANADVVPELQHAPITVVGGTNYYGKLVSGPAGNLTVACSGSSGEANLKTYNAAGQLIQEIPFSPQIDGVANCMRSPIVGKDGDVYGIPDGGPNLLAYSGNTLKWKYPLSCGYMSAPYTVGADGNIYAAQRRSDGEHLIGLTPEVTPPATQPTKVMDVSLPGICSGSAPVAYKDGIALQEYGGKWRFYSYNGTYLGRSPVGDLYSKVNADGRLFTQSYVSGTITSGNVSMYDPLTKKVLWTTRASTSGADTHGIWLTPLAGGGVAAHVREDKIDASGMPASPRKEVDTFVVINTAGQKVKTTQLPNADSQGNDYTSTSLSADSSGKVIMLREMAMGGYTDRPAISIGVYDPASDTWPYAKTMEGHPNNPNRYGYEYKRGGSDGRIQPASDTLHLMAFCRGSCPNYDYGIKVYSLKVNGLGQDYPRDTVINALSPVPYVALGDSYSSGEGTPPFEDGTEATGTNMCHRSYHSYGRLIGRDMGNTTSLGMGGFYACSGAVTQNITTTPQYNEGTQISHLDTHTKVVTLTIGGNDVGFEAFATGCFDPSSSCAINSAAYDTTLSRINNELPGKLSATYQAILSAAPSAQIYVLGYPQVAPVKTASNPIDARCPYLYDGGANWADAQGARSIVTALDDKIEQKVNDVRAMNAGNTRLHYIDVNASGSPFAGHTVCAEEATSFFNNADQALPPGQVRFVFHPNQRGQEAYAQLVTEALN